MRSLHLQTILVISLALQYRSKILGPTYAHKTHLCAKHARVCVFGTCMKYAQKTKTLVFMS